MKDVIPGAHHSGTPMGITASFDCKAREAAWKFGKELLPSRGEFSTLFDALQLSACGHTRPVGTDEYVPPTFTTPHGSLFVDAAAGADTNHGSMDKPLRSLEAAVKATAGRSNATIVLREGMHRINRTIELGTAHTNLTIQNFEGEHAAVSGAALLEIAPSAWQPYKIGTGKWVLHTGVNQVFGRATAFADKGPVKFLGAPESASACQKLAAAGDTCVSWDRAAAPSQSAHASDYMTMTTWVSCCHDRGTQPAPIRTRAESADCM